MLNPGSSSRDIGFLMETLVRVKSSMSRWGIRLSDRERSLIGEILSASSGPLPAPPPAPSSDPVYDGQEEVYRAKQALAKELSRRHGERMSRINSESVFVGPDGTPVQPSDSTSSGRLWELASKASPRVVDDPMSALDILSHNAAVTRVRAESPLTGGEAVSSRIVPGMPSIPGAADSARLAASERGDTMKGGGSFNTRYGPNVTSTRDIEAAAEAIDYGRK